MVILQVEFVVAEENVEKFVAMYRDVYQPTLARQDGYSWSTLGVLFSPAEAAEIDAHRGRFNVQLQLCFDTEQQRKAWAASEDHADPWAQATSLSSDHRWTAYHSVG